MTDPATRSTSTSPVPLVEPLVVFGATVGLTLVGSLLTHPMPATVAFTDRHLVSLVVEEAVLAALLVPWLVRRGWSPRAVAGAPEPLDVGRGVGVWLLAIGCYALTWILFAGLQPDAARALAADDPFTGQPAGALAVIVGSVVNPVFEEFLWLGYGVTRLAPRIGLRSAAALSVALRTSVHLYQGSWVVLAVLPLGVAFTWYYGRTRRLWPVVVAHVLCDAIGLAQRLASH
jgi:uncharacterized protein